MEQANHLVEESWEPELISSCFLSYVAFWWRHPKSFPLTCPFCIFLLFSVSRFPTWRQISHCLAWMSHLNPISVIQIPVPFGLLGLLNVLVYFFKLDEYNLKWKKQMDCTWLPYYTLCGCLPGVTDLLITFCHSERQMLLTFLLSGYSFFFLLNFLFYFP